MRHPPPPQTPTMLNDSVPTAIWEPKHVTRIPCDFLGIFVLPIHSVLAFRLIKSSPSSGQLPRKSEVWCPGINEQEKESAPLHTGI